MKKKFQVFISPTYTDMVEERQAAVEAILRAGHIPAGMELFAAGNESQWETIKHWIDDSDVFMLILGGRYGSFDSTTQKSYIHREYEYAIERQKPFFAAVISDDSLDFKVKKNGKSVIETDHSPNLKSFRDLVTSKICRFFSELNELKLIVLESLLNFERNDVLSGWIRGTDVIDLKSTLEEMSRLQKENVALRDELTHVRSLLPSNGQTVHQRILNSITKDAKQLLLAAGTSDAKFKYGDIFLKSHLSGVDGTHNVNREAARWRAALDELVSNDCVVLAPFGEIRITKLGYEIFDELNTLLESL